jgi:hypothetical protein
MGLGLCPQAGIIDPAAEASSWRQELNLQDFQLSCAALNWAVMLVAENKLQVDKEIDQERNPDAQKLCEYCGERYNDCADGSDANIDRQPDQGP